jgi:hypothetical protein
MASATKPRYQASRARSIRRPAVGKIDRGRARPLPAKHVGHDADRLTNAARHRVAVLGIADRRPQDLAERHRPVIAQQPHPGTERSRHRSGEQPGARDQIEAELAEPRDRRGLGCNTLPANHVAAAIGLAPHQHRRLTERAVGARLDHLQCEAGGGRRVERVAAFFEHAHADGRSQPMGRGDDAEGAADLGSGGKAGHFSLSRMSRYFDRRLDGVGPLGNGRSIATAEDRPIY